MAETTLNAKHRCDRCGSRAYVSVVLLVSERLPDGGVLMYCCHHAKLYMRAMAPFIAAVVDESYQITEHIADDKHLV